jgi:MYXO-CTERM domain-containing protein
VAVPAASLDDKLEERRQNLDRGLLEEIAAAGKPCHEPFSGFRTVVDTTGLRDLPSVPAGTGAAAPKRACGCEIGPGAAQGVAGLWVTALGLLALARRRRSD